VQLITEFRGYDGILGEDILDNVAITGVTIVGPRITIWGSDLGGRGHIVAHAELRVQGKTALWHLSKGQRGKEIGIATEVGIHV